MNMGRVLDITMNGEGNMYAMAEKREKYVSYLLDHEHKSQMNKVDQARILEWAQTRMAPSFTIT